MRGGVLGTAIILAACSGCLHAEPSDDGQTESRPRDDVDETDYTTIGPVRGPPENDSWQDLPMGCDRHVPGNVTVTLDVEVQAHEAVNITRAVIRLRDADDSTQVFDASRPSADGCTILGGPTVGRYMVSGVIDNGMCGYSGRVYVQVPEPEDHEAWALVLRGYCA